MEAMKKEVKILTEPEELPEAWRQNVSETVQR